MCSVAAADDEAKMRLRAFLENKTPPPRITIGTTGLLINDTLVEIDDRCVAGFPTGLPRARLKYMRKNNTPANIGSLQEKMVTS